MINADNTASSVTSTATMTAEPKQPQHELMQHHQQQPIIASLKQPESQKEDMKPPPQPSVQLKPPPPPPSSQQQEPEPIRPTGPIHVLMAMSSSKSLPSAATAKADGGRVDNGKPRAKPTKRERMQRLLLDPALQGDYVSKRLKAYQRAMPKPGEVIKDEKKKTAPAQQKGKSKQAKRANLNASSWTSPTSVWDGVSQVERDLVKCCQSTSFSSSSSYLEGYSASSQKEEDELRTRGTLQIEKEVEFVGILARDCHTLSSKSLALAILERTLQLYLKEEAEEEEEEEDDEEMEEEAAKPSGEKAKADDEKLAGTMRSGSKRAPAKDESTSEESRKKQKLENGKSESTAENVASVKGQDNDEAEEEEEEDDDDEEEEEGQPTRLEGFLAASGLKILNQWLIDACTEETEPAPKAPANGKGQLPKLKPPATRPLILPMLRFLEQIPFDKKVVLDAKINKQIRKLGKHVTAIRKALEQNTHEPVDLLNWSLDPTVNAKDALDDVHQAIKDLKSSWERMAKHDPRQFDDPFESLKEIMKERLDVLLQFEVGEAPKPDWFDDVEAGKNSSKKPTKSKISNTKELAAKERLAEREHLKSQLLAAQTEHRERLAQLREKLRGRRDADVAAAPRSNGKQNNGKRVVWKDGLRSQVSRNRKELEQVFVFEKTAPAARDAIEVDDDVIEIADDDVEEVEEEEEDGPPLADELMNDAEADAENDGLL